MFTQSLWATGRGFSIGATGDRMRAMLKKSLNYVLVALAAGVILFSGFVLGVSAERRGGADLAFIPKTPTDIGTSTPDMTLFWQAWQLVNQKYLRNADVSNEDKVRGAVAGLVGSLGDPYSEYFAPKDAQGFEEDVNGNFGGIGAQLGIQKGTLTVVSPLKGSPAAAAGLKPGDQILFIEATSTEGIAIEEAVNYIRGPVGTPVKLTIMRKGWDKPKDFTITRDEIAAPTLDFTMESGDVAYIQLYQFNANADQLFLNAIRKAALAGARGVVLDLRGNPGGYLDVAVNIAGWFLPRGTVVVSQQGRDGMNEVMRANGNEALVRIPTVVLIDGGSASASEILSGALRDQRHIPLVGDTSFGKGTVQELEDLPDGSLVKLTIAHWVLPSGHILENGGLTPDYEVKLTDADVAANKDPQLDKALSLIRQELAK